MGRRLVVLTLSGFLALACEESSDSDGDGERGSSGSPSVGGAGETSAGAPAGGAGGTSAGGAGGTSTGGTGGTTAGGTGGTSAGAPSGGTTSGDGGASGGAGAGVSGSGAVGGCASGGAQSGGGAGAPAWTCVEVDDLCECAHDSNGTLPSCSAELNCCMTFLVPDECSPEERCFCQPATEEQCADAVERTEPIYMAVRSESCPP